MNEVQVNSQGNVQSVDFTSQEPIQPQRSSQTEMMVTRQAQEVQVAMLAAKKFPRDQVVAYNNIMRACQRRKLAESSMYEFPRGNEKITGPSIRLAEAIAQNWGNIDFGFMELEQRNGASQVMAYAWDLETNSRQTKLFSVPHIRHTRKGDYPLTDPRDIYEAEGFCIGEYSAYEFPAYVDGNKFFQRHACIMRKIQESMTKQYQ